MNGSFDEPDPDEVTIIDEAAEQAARASLGRDAADLGYSLRNGRVSRLADTKIVRLNLYDPGRRKDVGVAVRVERAGSIDEAINLFGP